MSPLLTTTDAIQRYCDVQDRLPIAVNPVATTWVQNLDDLIDEFDLFVLDGFGVLNVGAEPVPGAADRIKSLRAAKKKVVVLTNGATGTTPKLAAKYKAWDMAFDTKTIISSRDALMHGLQQLEYRSLRWGIAGSSYAAIDQLPVHSHLLSDSDSSFENCEGFILLSAIDWTDDRQRRLIDALKDNPRPVLVGNPDIVAPHPGRLSLEPGYYAHDIADELGIEPVFFGKPFKNAFDAVTRRHPGFDPKRIAMVGDSPHTDILGGGAAGWRTVLVHQHGLCKEHELESVFTECGIRPDFVALTT